MVALSCISPSSAILSLSANLSLRKKMYTAPKQLFYTASWKQKMYTASQLFYTTSRELKMYTASQQGFSIQHLSSHQVLSGCHTNTEEAYLFWLPPHYDLWHWFNWGHLLFFSSEIGHYQWLFIAASMSEFITFIPRPWFTTGDVQEFRAILWDMRDPWVTSMRREFRAMWDVHASYMRCDPMTLSDSLPLF